MSNSGLSDKLVQLSFGKAMPTISHCLGIYLSPALAFVAEVATSGEKPKVEHLVRVPLPPPPAPAQGTRVTGVLNSDVLSDTERLAGLLKPAMSQAGRWRSEYAVVTLSHAFGILRYFAMPAVDPKFWKMAVPAEAKKYIPVQFDDLVNDYQIEALPPGMDRRPRQGALFGVTQAKNIEHINALLDKLGYKMAGVELAPCSVGRLWDAVEPAGGAPYANVHFDRGNATVILSERGLPIFVREILLGADAKVADRRKLDLTGCIDFSKKQLGSQRPAKIRLSGTSAEMAAWQEALAQEAQAPVSVVDPKKLLGIDALEMGSLAAIGAGARHLVPNKIILDVSGIGRIDEVDRRAVMSIFGVSAALAAVFLGLGIFRFASAMMKTGELRRLRSKANVPAFQSKSKDEIERMMADMKQRSAGLAAATAGSVKLTDVLTELVEDLPEQAWLTNIAYQYSLDSAVAGGIGNAASRTLTLSGAVVAASEAAEQDVAYKFKESLQKDERFSKAFNSVEVSASAGGSESSRTVFTMTCAGKR